MRNVQKRLEPGKGALDGDRSPGLKGRRKAENSHMWELEGFYIS